MDPQLPPGWQILRNPNGQVIYANVSTGLFQDTPPAAAAALALPPGWIQMTNDSGRTVYINQSLHRMQFEFPQAEAEQAQAPSARQRILDRQHQEAQAQTRKDAETKAAFENHMMKWQGGLKGKRKQTKRKQTKRKEVKRKQTKRRT